MENIDLSLILPCYNEEKIIMPSIRQIFEVLDDTKFSYEIIFVDDYSRDKTKELIDEITALYPEKRITKILHRRNTGRGGAVVSGIKIAKGQIVGFLDIDLEVHPRYIPSCISAVKNGYDISTGRRIYKVSLTNFIRFMVSQCYILLVRKLLRLNLLDTETGFKFFNKNKILPILDEIKEEGWFWDTEIMARSYYKNLKICEIPVLFLKRKDKKSSVKLIKDSLDYLIKLNKFSKKLKDGK